MNVPDYDQWIRDLMVLKNEYEEATGFFRKDGPIPRKKGMAGFLDKLLKPQSVFPNLLFDLPKDAAEPERSWHLGWGVNGTQCRMEYRWDLVRRSAAQFARVIQSAETMPLPEFAGREIFMDKLRFVSAGLVALEAKMFEFLPPAVRKKRVQGGGPSEGG